MKIQLLFVCTIEMDCISSIHQLQISQLLCQALRINYQVNTFTQQIKNRGAYQHTTSGNNTSIQFYWGPVCIEVSTLLE